MRKEIIRYRWVFVVTMFLFLFYQQLIGFLIEPLTMVFRGVSSFSDLWLNIELPIDIFFALIFFLVWGILFDRLSRRSLISLAGFLWGVSAWLMALAPTFALFNVSKAISGVDRASHSGIYAMVGDLFKPTNRGKILGLLLLAQPLALFFAVIMSDRLEDLIQWRSVFLMLGAIGFLLAVMIHNFVKEPKRGAKEPALGDVEMTGTYQFDWDLAKNAFTKPGLILMYVYIFFSIFPWVVMSEGFLNFLREITGLQTLEFYLILTPIMFGITLGFPVGGLLGDALFRFKKNGRLLISLVGVIAPSICLYYAFRGQNVQGQGFLVSILLMGFFMAFPWSNIFASVMDITLPELRASAFGLALIFQTIGVLVSPLILSLAQRTMGLIDTLLWLSIGAWAICLVILVLLLIFVPRDIEKLRRHMAYRSHLEVRLQQEKQR
jgi:MFS family permease